MSESDLVFILEAEVQHHWASDTSWRQDDPSPDWMALSVLFTSLFVEVSALFLV